MCLQCLAKVISFNNELHPFLNGDFFFCKATITAGQFEQGMFAIGRTNDPDFYFHYSLNEDPTYKKSDVEIEGMLHDIKAWEKWDVFAKMCDHIEISKTFQCDPELGHKLIESAKLCGYESGSFLHWLFGYIYNYLTNENTIVVDLDDKVLNKNEILLI